MPESAMDHAVETALRRELEEARADNVRLAALLTEAEQFVHEQDRPVRQELRLVKAENESLRAAVKHHSDEMERLRADRDDIINSESSTDEQHWHAHIKRQADELRQARARLAVLEPVFRAAVMWASAGCNPCGECDPLHPCTECLLWGVARPHAIDAALAEKGKT